jgi:hypothetical protein
MFSSLMMLGRFSNVVLEEDGEDRVRNEEVLHRVSEEMSMLHTIKEGRPTGLVTSCVGTAS